LKAPQLAAGIFTFVVFVMVYGYAKSVAEQIHVMGQMRIASSKILL